MIRGDKHDSRVHPPAGAPWDSLGDSKKPAPVVCMGLAGLSYTQMIFMGPRCIGEPLIGAW